MMRALARFTCAVWLVLFASVAGAEDLSGTWLLKIENLNHEEIASLVIRFTDKDAKSCLGGGRWQRVQVKSSKTIDKTFFPVSDPLSFQLVGSTLTIGRNEICDNYLHLTGTLVDGGVTGGYSGFGIEGGDDLGFFTLRRSKPGSGAKP